MLSISISAVRRYLTITHDSFFFSLSRSVFLAFGHVPSPHAAVRTAPEIFHGLRPQTSLLISVDL